jgi:hypothetical protein
MQIILFAGPSKMTIDLAKSRTYENNCGTWAKGGGRI